MTVDMVYLCGCSAEALNELILKGSIEPNKVFAKLSQETGASVQVGDVIKYETSTNSWTRVNTDDTLTNYIVGVVATLKDLETGAVYNVVNVDTEAFLGAITWASNGDPIKASCLYLYDSGTRTQFAPETHTGLASKFNLIPFTGHDGSTESYYVALK